MSPRWLISSALATDPSLSEGVHVLEVRLARRGPYVEWPIRPLTRTRVRELESLSKRKGQLDEARFLALVVFEGSPELQAGAAALDQASNGDAAGLVLRRFSERGRYGLLAQIARRIFELSGEPLVQIGTAPPGCNPRAWRTLHLASFALPARHYRGAASRRPIARSDRRPCRRPCRRRARRHLGRSKRRARSAPHLGDDDPPDLASLAPRLTSSGGLSIARGRGRK